MALPDGTRGRVVLDNITVLFQFVPAPPESVRMANRQDFRPKLFDEDDPIFVGTMSVFMALAAVLMIYVWNTDPVATVDVEAYKDRFVEMMVEAAKEQKEEQEIEPVETLDGEPVEEEEAPPRLSGRKTLPLQLAEPLVLTRCPLFSTAMAIFS